MIQWTWRARLALLGCVLAITWWAFPRSGLAESGEYSTIVTLLTKGPQGTHPASLQTPSRALEGTVNLTVGLDGVVTGTLQTYGPVVLMAGKLKVSRGRAKLILKSVGGNPVKFVGDVQQGNVVGKLKDRTGALGGNGTLTIDLAGAEPLQVTLRLALRNAFQRKRTGFATVEANSTQVPATAIGKVTPYDSLLKVRAGKFKFDARGRVEGALFRITLFKCRAYGLTVYATSGTLAYAPNPPDVTLLLSSGHHGLCCASDSEPYLSYAGDAGPAVASALTSAGLRVETGSFVDHADGTAYGPGYDDFVATLQFVRDTYLVGRAFPTKVVVVAHSHGGVRAHQAIRAVSDLPVRELVDLDASSCAFKTGHLLEVEADPVDAWFINGRYYDEEDVVQPNVQYALEILSNQLCPASLINELYDDSFNVRTDGSYGGLFYHEAFSDHSEVHQAGGASMQVVIPWMVKWL